MSKTDIYCNNCGKKNHSSRKCREPITSVGIIAIYIEDYDINKIVKYYEEKPQINISNCHGVEYETYEDFEIFGQVKDKIKFLLIQRKYSMGYIQFMRGLYELSDGDGLVSMFKNMIPSEIDKIKNKTFEENWKEFYMTNQLSKDFLEKCMRDYKMIYTKYIRLKDNIDVKLDLNFLLNIHPTWTNCEWGYPKGRRNLNETMIDCAKREFEEESGYKNNEYIFLNNILPLTEEFKGTDNKKYKTIYYFSLIKSPRNPYVDITNINQVWEIGDIKYNDYFNVGKLLRFIERINITTLFYMHILSVIIKAK